MKTLIILLSVILSSCTIEFGKQYDPNKILDAKILKGNHYAENYPLMEIYTSDEIWRTIIFKDNCRYDLKNNNQFDTNKLFGLGQLGIVDWKSAHLENSARFGWRWNLDKNLMEIMAFSHVDGMMKFYSMGYVELNDEIYLRLKIDWTNKVYVYRMIKDGMLIKEYKEKFNCDKYIKTELSLYFGGDETAPHDMNIIYKYN